MSDFYTVAIDNSTPVEITGGRVGNFLLNDEDIAAVFIGPSTLAVTYSPTVVTDGMPLVSGSQLVRQLSVTSPDEIYAVIVNSNSGDPLSRDLKIFHNR